VGKAFTGVGWISSSSSLSLKKDRPYLVNILMQPQNKFSDKNIVISIINVKETVVVISKGPSISKVEYPIHIGSLKQKCASHIERREITIENNQVFKRR